MLEPSFRERVRRMPKAELHVHALGAMRPGTIVELAKAKDAAVLPVAEQGLAEGFAFEGLTAFVEFYIGLFELVSDRDAFGRVAYEILEDASRSGTKHVEMRWSPWSHLSRGVDEDEMFAGLEAARREAERSLDVTARWVLDFPRTLPLDVAQTTLDVALRRRREGVVGIDIAGDEATTAVDPRFTPIFAKAWKEGMGVTAHAGEGAGPESVVGALDVYGATRIGHGTRAVEDEALLGRLRAANVTLEVCPTSNVRLGVVASIEAHPLRRFLDARIPCTISTDDPTLFATDLVEEYVRVHEAIDVTFAEARHLAAEGFLGAFTERDPSGGDLWERLEFLAQDALVSE